MWTIHRHGSFENSKGENAKCCPPLPQALGIKGDVTLGIPHSHLFGRKWRSVSVERPSAGKSVKNSALESALPTKVNFTQKEWAAFGIAHLHFDDYITSKINDVVHYFQPAASQFDQWACKSEASEEYKLMTLRTFQTGPQWLSERRISARWTPLSESSELEWKSSICICVKQICTDPTTSSLHKVARLMESLHGLINEIQRQHSPELPSFEVNEVNLTGYTNEHNMLQAIITLKKRQGVEIGLDQITGLTLAFWIGNSTLSTDSGHEYKCCPASNRIGVTSCGVMQITKATWWQTSRSKIMLGANFDADGTLIMTSSDCATMKRLVSIMNSGDQTRLVARLKKPVFSRHGHIFSGRDHISPVDEIGPDNNSSENDVTKSTGLDGTQTCGELSLIPGTSPEGAKLGRATCSSTHVAIDMSLKNNDGSAPLVSQQNLPAEIISRCKQCEETFTISISQQQFFSQKAMSTPARCTRCRRWNRSKALHKPGGDISKGSSDSRFREVLASWAMKSGWWTEARSIEEQKWTQACAMQKQQLVGTLGLLWKRVDKIKSLDMKIDNEALALALQSQVSFTNVEWDELKVHDTVICTSYTSSEKLFFKPALPETPAGTVGGSESEIAGSLVRDFWTAIEYGRVPEFLGRLRNRCHRLIARWGEEILLETSGN